MTIFVAAQLIFFLNSITRFYYLHIIKMKILWKTGINVVCPHVRCVCACVWRVRVSELAKLSGKVFCISIFGQHAQQPQQQREWREGGRVLQVAGRADRCDARAAA